MNEFKHKTIFRQAEIKRVCENITKKELTTMLSINNTYYSNCVSGINTPSELLIRKLMDYIEMDTTEVYKRIFEMRQNPVLNQRKVFIDDDGNAKEEFNSKLNISQEEFKRFRDKLRKEKTLVWG